MTKKKAEYLSADLANDTQDSADDIENGLPCLIIMPVDL